MELIPFLLASGAVILTLGILDTVAEMTRKRKESEEKIDALLDEALDLAERRS